MRKLVKLAAQPQHKSHFWDVVYDPLALALVGAYLVAGAKGDLFISHVIIGAVGLTFKLLELHEKAFIRNSQLLMQKQRNPILIVIIAVGLVSIIFFLQVAWLLTMPQINESSIVQWILPVIVLLPLIRFAVLRMLRR